MTIRDVEFSAVQTQYNTISLLSDSYASSCILSGSLIRIRQLIIILYIPGSVSVAYTAPCICVLPCLFILYCLFAF